MVAVGVGDQRGAHVGQVHAGSLCRRTDTWPEVEQQLTIDERRSRLSKDAGQPRVRARRTAAVWVRPPRPTGGAQ